MDFALSSLINPDLWPLAGESRTFYARRAAGRGPSGWEELRVVRASAAPPTGSHPSAVEELASADGRHVPVRIHLPEAKAVTGVLLEIHGGGF